MGAQLTPFHNKINLSNWEKKARDSFIALGVLLAGKRRMERRSAVESSKHYLLTLKSFLEGLKVKNAETTKDKLLKSIEDDGFFASTKLNYFKIKR